MEDFQRMGCVSDEKPRGSHFTAITKIDNEKVIAVAWKGKSDKSKKNKNKRKFWL